uniref:C-type lectin domain-containing protein n=1 Tax=Cyprinus carpio TaxID=7962 RepID=A0A8C2ITH9_CYPCA
MKYRKDKEDLDNKTQKTQTPQHTGSDSVRSRSSRAAVVCLVLLCVLLLTAVIVLCVHIYTNNTNYTQERDQLLTNITNLTEDRHELIIKNKNLMNVIKLVVDGWTYYQSSIYYMSKEKMNWTESRRYCMDTGADLITINNTEKRVSKNKQTNKKTFYNMSGGAAVWIGVTDSDVEGTWKWVDGRNVTSEFWAYNAQIKEPNGATKENCAVTVAVPQEMFCELVGWIDVACNRAFQWICEKRISQFILP